MSSSDSPKPCPSFPVAPLSSEEQAFLTQRAKSYTDIVERFERLDAMAEMIECAKRSRDEALRRS